MLRRSLPLTLLLLLSLPTVAFARSSVSWDKTLRQPVRKQIEKCMVLLSPRDEAVRSANGQPIDLRVNDSVGIPVSGNSPEEASVALERIVQERGREALLGSHLFVLGVPTSREAQTIAGYHQMLSRLGFAPEDVRIRVLSVPKSQVRRLSVQAFREALARFAYFFPSLKRDFQTPMRSEIISSLISSSVIEIPNMLYLYNALPTLDANLTVLTHLTLIGSYTIFNRFLVNWMLRTRTGIEGFLKQVITSFPFVLNYNLFGKFSKVAAAYQELGWDGTVERFPELMASFGASQGVTLFLQTLFYNLVITNGVRAWGYSQHGTENNNDARVLVPWIKSPLMILDAIFLAQAASTGHPLMQLGPLALNTGHAALAGMTLAGSIIALKPQVLDPTLRWYQRLKRLVKKHP